MTPAVSVRFAHGPTSRNCPGTGADLKLLLARALDGRMVQAVVPDNR